MTARRFPSKVVFACVAIFREKNIPLDQKELVPLVSYLSNIPERELHNNLDRLMSAAKIVGMWLAAYYSAFSRVSYPDGSKGDEVFDTWWEQQLGTAGITFEIDSPQGVVDEHS